jgi:replicative DNA helicase
VNGRPVTVAEVVADAQASGLDIVDAPEISGNGPAAYREHRRTKPGDGPMRLVPGGSFALDLPADEASIWGRGSQILWAPGEPLVIVGPVGSIKTTLQLRLALVLIGVGGPDLLGFPVTPTDGLVLYVAADRPRQIRRNLHRMVTEDHRGLLDERLVVWEGPLPFDLSKEPERFSPWVQDHGAGVVLLDSYKDVALDLAKDEGASRLGRALQHAVADGIEVSGSHHLRKGDGGARTKPPTSLDEVYGNVWITAGVDRRRLRTIHVGQAGGR